VEFHHTGIVGPELMDVDAAFLSFQGAWQTLRKRSGWQGRAAGTPTELLGVFVVLAMRRPPHEARAALVLRRHNAVKSRFQCVLTQ
jgi:hypothetical protein